MKTKNGASPEDGELKKPVKENREKPTKKVEIPKTKSNLNKLVHELNTYQSELEKINYGLKQSSDRLEDQFTELYDFTREGYINVSRDGKICKVNDTACKMIGVDRSRLINNSLAQYISPESHPVLDELLRNVFENNNTEKCEVYLNPKSIKLKHIALLAALCNNGKECKIIMTDINGRNYNEELFQRERILLRTVIDNLPDAVYAKDINGRKILANLADLKNIGAKNEGEVLGKTDHNVFPKDIADKFWEDDQTVMQKDQPVINREEFLINTDGKKRWLLTSKLPLKDEDGNITGLVGIGHDITERKLMEEELHILSLRQSAILASVPDIIMEVDGNKVYRWANAAGLKFFGGDVIGKEAAFYFEGEQDTYLKVNPLFDGNDNTIYVESWQRRKDGEKRLLAWWCKTLKDAKGNVTGVLSTARDITEKKNFELLQNAVYRISQAADKIATLNDLYKSVHEIISAIIPAKNFFIATYDEHNNSISFPYSIDERDVLRSTRLFGNGLTEFVLRSGKSLLVNSEQIIEMSNKGEIIQSGTLSAIWLGVPLIVGDKTIGVMALQHYSDSKAYGEREQQMFEYVSSQIARAIERKRTEEELLKAKEEAEKSDKMKTEFLAQMSHEVRTPLNVITANVDYLKEEISDKINSESLECFDYIELSSRRIIRTIDLILNMSEIQLGLFKPMFSKVDIDSQVLTKLYHEYKKDAMSKGIDFVYNCDAKEPEIEADEYCVTQICSNLIDNAIKYTQKGGVGILLTRNIDGRLIIEIKDTGAGISKEFLPQLFMPFKQEHQGYTRRYEGNGLGLALVKGYCDINNAVVEVESEKNTGSTFRIIFMRGL